MLNQPLILRLQHLIEAFTQSDEEHDFYLNLQEGYLIFVNFEKEIGDLELAEETLEKEADHFVLIPKMTYYDDKTFLERFVAEKVFGIHVIDRLIDTIQGKDARANFLAFIYDNAAELDKWNAYYEQKFRIMVIAWLRSLNLHFVFEEDLTLPVNDINKLKQNHLKKERVSSSVNSLRKVVQDQSKKYYLDEALNPRPRRGRPPKHVKKKPQKNA